MYDDAINDYTRALEIDNKNAFAYYNVIYWIRLKRGISYDKKGDYD